MAYNTSSLVTLGILKDAITRMRADCRGAISTAGHITFVKTDIVPTVETAQENVLYLTPGGDAEHYTAYALIDGAIVCVGETSAEIGDYVTTEQLNTAVDNAIDNSIDGKIATQTEVTEMFNEVFNAGTSE